MCESSYRSKKDTFTQPEGVLHPYFGAEGDGLRRWVRGKFQVEVLDVEMFPEHNVALVTGVLQGPKERMELFTLSQAIQSLKGREEGVARFLDRRREIFGVQLRYGLREGKILSIGGNDAPGEGASVWLCLPKLRETPSGKNGKEGSVALCSQWDRESM